MDSGVHQNKKVGVLTFHRCINYGSYWQTRCLIEWLNRNGYNAVILDHDSPRVTLAELRCAYRPQLPSAWRRSDFPQFRHKISRFLEAIGELPLSPRFPLESPDRAGDYDVVVVGSDEVWNLSHPWYGGYPIFFGENLSTGRLVSYAASFGNYHVSGGLEDRWVNRLRRFSSISVRDLNSLALVRENLGCEPEVVVDPCLLSPPQLASYEPVRDDRYIAVYGHNFSDRFKQNVRTSAADLDARVVSIGYRNDWADESWLDADPMEFALSIRDSAGVATNFFHGCVFALNNRKPFVCETTSYRLNKIIDLLEITGSSHRLFDDSTTERKFAELLGTPVSQDVVHRIELLRRQSEAFLRRAI